MAVSVRRRFDFGGGNPMVFFEGITEMPDILIAQQVGCFINDGGIPQTTAWYRQGHSGLL